MRRPPLQTAVPATLPVRCPACGERVDLPAGREARCGMCGTAVSAWSGATARFNPAAPERIAALKTQRRGDPRLTGLFTALGILLTVGAQGLFYLSEGPPRNALFGAAGMGISLLGFAAGAVGFTFSARYKGRSPWWGPLGLVMCSGIIVLLVLPDLLGRRIAALEGQVVESRGRPERPAEGDED